MSQYSGFSNPSFYKLTFLRCQRGMRHHINGIIFDNFINGISTGLVCLAVEIVSIKIVWELERAGEDAEN